MVVFIFHSNTINHNASIDHVMIIGVVPRMWITDSGSQALRDSLSDLMTFALTVRGKHQLMDIDEY